VLTNATTLSFDLTLLSAQINGGSGFFSGFAQSNEVAVQLFAPSGGPLPTGLNIFSQRNFTTGGGTDTSGQSATWSGVDGTRTITFNLTTFTGTDPVTNTSQTLSQLLTTYGAQITDAKISFVEQTGGGTPVGPANYFFDNVQLIGPSGPTIIGNFEPVPEPSSMALMAVAVPAVIGAVRRKWRRKSQDQSTIVPTVT
jgi:hypothetical protein